VYLLNAHSRIDDWLEVLNYLENNSSPDAIFSKNENCLLLQATASINFTEDNVWAFYIR